VLIFNQQTSPVSAAQGQDLAPGDAAANFTAGLHAGFTEMTVEDLRAALDADRDVLLLDVRATVAPPLLLSKYA